MVSEYLSWAVLVLGEERVDSRGILRQGVGFTLLFFHPFLRFPCLQKLSVLFSNFYAVQQLSC